MLQSSFLLSGIGTTTACDTIEDTWAVLCGPLPLGTASTAAMVHYAYVCTRAAVTLNQLQTVALSLLPSKETPLVSLHFYIETCDMGFQVYMPNIKPAPLNLLRMMTS